MVSFHRISPVGSLGIAVAVFCFPLNSHAAERGGSALSPVSAVGELGDIATFKPAHAGRWHVRGSLGVASSDYSRGAYDNEDEDLDQVAFGVGLSTTVQLVQGATGPLQGLNFTLGTSNGIASGDNRRVLDDGHWYESNWYLGLSARLGEHWLGAITQSGFSSPINDFDFTQETTLAAQYANESPLGQLSPQLKVTKPVGEQDDGWLIAANIAPQMPLTQGHYPVTLSFPLEIGVGFDEYYGADRDAGQYLDVGVGASLPLKGISGDYGNWNLGSQLGVLARSEEIRQADPEFSRDTLVPYASLTLNVAY
ncbi:hypothetical protein DFO67_111101 [Modicisalibacter xianhensis]|uniref:Uncharacterized protein n=1 Tax=Modicisalibacter xianhensis TaxID=442341 RepID=A0A4R8FZG1_9GAMM|nr:hypothetical protein [Halomonas xianhensis]TDX28122.1 hypothetical protein DFO67_111101 [Halomonas xianhensis]